MSHEEQANAMSQGQCTATIIGRWDHALRYATDFAAANFQVRLFDAHHDFNVKSPVPNGIDEFLARHVQAGRIRVSHDLLDSMENSSAIILCFSFLEGPGVGDFKDGVLAEVARSLPEHCLVVNSSFCHPGYTETELTRILERHSGLKAYRDFGVAYACLESDPFLSQAYSVVGSHDPESLRAALGLLSCIFDGRILAVPNTKFAEAVVFSRLARAYVNSALSHELYRFAEENGFDFEEVKRYAGWEAYDSSRPLLLGSDQLGDLKSPRFGRRLSLIESASRVSEEVPKRLVAQLGKSLRSAGRAFRGSHVSVLGLATGTRPPKVNRIVEEALRTMKRKGADLKAYDPLLKVEEIERLGVQAVSSRRTLLEGAHVLVIGASRAIVGAVNPEEVASYLRPPGIIADWWRVTDAEEVAKFGMIYTGPGRGMALV